MVDSLKPREGEHFILKIWARATSQTEMLCPTPYRWIVISALVFLLHLLLLDGWHCEQRSRWDQPLVVLDDKDHRVLSSSFHLLYSGPPVLKRLLMSSIQRLMLDFEMKGLCSSSFSLRQLRSQAWPHARQKRVTRNLFRWTHGRDTRSDRYQKSGVGESWQTTPIARRVRLRY